MSARASRSVALNRLLAAAEVARQPELRLGRHPEHLLEPVLRIVGILAAALRRLLRVGELDLEEVAKRGLGPGARQQVRDLLRHPLVGIGIVLRAQGGEVARLDIEGDVERRIADIARCDAAPQIGLAHLPANHSADVDRHRQIGVGIALELAEARHLVGISAAVRRELARLLVGHQAGGQPRQVLRFGIVVAELVLAQRTVGARGLEAALLGERNGVIDAEVVGGDLRLVRGIRVAGGVRNRLARDGGRGREKGKDKQGTQTRTHSALREWSGRGW